MDPLRRDGRRSVRPLALHAVLQSWTILRLGCRGFRDRSAAPWRFNGPSSQRPNAAHNDASLTIDRQDRDRDDLSYYVGHSFRLAWRVAASLLLISPLTSDIRFIATRHSFFPAPFLPFVIP